MMWHDVAQHRREPGPQTSESVASTIKFDRGVAGAGAPGMGQVVLDLFGEQGEYSGYFGDDGSAGAHGDEVSEVEDNLRPCRLRCCRLIPAGEELRGAETGINLVGTSAAACRTQTSGVSYEFSPMDLDKSRLPRVAERLPYPTSRRQAGGNIAAYARVSNLAIHITGSDFGDGADHLVIPHRPHRQREE